MRKLFVMVLRMYSYAISPLFPASCRFYPSCSLYAQEAVTEHGCVRGTVLIIRRLLRCHPWNHGGCDPVPTVQSRDSMQR